MLDIIYETIMNLSSTLFLLLILLITSVTACGETRPVIQPIPAGIYDGNVHVTGTDCKEKGLVGGDSSRVVYTVEVKNSSYTIDSASPLPEPIRWRGLASDNEVSLSTDQNIPIGNIDLKIVGTMIVSPTPGGFSGFQTNTTQVDDLESCLSTFTITATTSNL